MICCISDLCGKYIYPSRYSLFIGIEERLPGGVVVQDKASGWTERLEGKNLWMNKTYEETELIEGGLDAKCILCK